MSAQHRQDNPAYYIRDFDSGLPHPRYMTPAQKQLYISQRRMWYESDRRTRADFDSALHLVSMGTEEEKRRWFSVK